MSLTQTLTPGGTISWVRTDLATDGTSVADQNNYSKSFVLTNGTGAAGTADLLIYAQYSIAGAGTQSIDVSGALTDRFGNTITMARVKGIFIKPLSSTDDAASTGGPVKVGASTSAGLQNWIGSAGTFGTDAPYIRVRGGGAKNGFFSLWCDDATAYAVTASTADILKLTNEDATLTVKVQVAIGGSSA